MDYGIGSAPAVLPERLVLPQVTLCAATSVNVTATVRALEASMAQIDFAACKLFTDSRLGALHPGISVVPIGRLTSSAAYSAFVLSQLVDHVATPYCLVAQWDGHVIDAERWRPEFLEYDYIGARWPQFDDGHDVGNGGFSLRSRQLMEACREVQFRGHHPEDIAIGRTNRFWLEERGFRFAPPALADQFSTERAGDLSASFGYHGAWNMPRAIGIDAFWQVYGELDDRGPVMHDFSSILKHIGTGQRRNQRVAGMIFDFIKFRLGTGRRKKMSAGREA